MTLAVPIDMTIRDLLGPFGLQLCGPRWCQVTPGIFKDIWSCIGFIIRRAWWGSRFLDLRGVLRTFSMHKRKSRTCMFKSITNQQLYKRHVKLRASTWSLRPFENHLRNHRFEKQKLQLNPYVSTLALAQYIHAAMLCRVIAFHDH